MKKLPKLRAQFLYFSCLALLAGCSSGPPITISDIGNYYKNVSCNYEEPYCKKLYEEAGSKAASEMSGKTLEPFIMQVTSISESSNAKDKWDIRGKMVWDQAEEDGQAAFNAGLLVGVLTLGQAGGEVIKEGLAQPVGKCLTTPNETYSGVAAMNLEAYEVNIPDLKGVKEGSYLTISGGDLVAIGKEKGWLKTKYSIPHNRSFGVFEVGINKPSGSLATVKKIFKKCRN